MSSKKPRVEIPDLDDFATQIAEKIANPKEVKTDEKILRDYIKAHTFDINKKPPDDVAVLFHDGKQIGSRGNIVTITGPAKSRKTVIMSAIAKSFFLDAGFDSLGFTSKLHADEKLLHIDTEQGYQHYYQAVCRIFQGTGKSIPERFHSLHTRDADIKLRIELTEFLLAELMPSVVFIDGITDYIYDINSQEEAVQVGEKLLKWSYRYNCLIIAVIHTTKSTGYMTGAIGTYLEKKCETSIKVIKPEDNDSISDVICQYSRGVGFPAFTIEMDQDKGQYVRIDDRRATAKGKHGDKSPEAYADEIHAAVLARVFQYRQTLNDYELSREIINAMNLVNGDKILQKVAKKFIDYYHSRAMMIQSPDTALWMRAGMRKLEEPQRQIFSSDHLAQEPDFFSTSDDLPF
jgi:hypothetical protein